MWWACSSAGGVYLSAPVSQWGQVRIRLPLATRRQHNEQPQPSPGARSAADNDVANGCDTTFGAGFEQKCRLTQLEERSEARHDC